MTNPNCDGSGPHDKGECHLLPTGGNSNAILCRNCYGKEIRYRKLRNRTLDRHARFELPFWSDLKVYTGE